MKLSKIQQECLEHLKDNDTSLEAILEKEWNENF